MILCFIFEIYFSWWISFKTVLSNFGDYFKCFSNFWIDFEQKSWILNMFYVSSSAGKSWCYWKICLKSKSYYLTLPFWWRSKQEKSVFLVIKAQIILSSLTKSIILRQTKGGVITRLTLIAVRSWEYVTRWCFLTLRFFFGELVVVVMS